MLLLDKTYIIYEPIEVSSVDVFNETVPIYSPAVVLSLACMVLVNTDDSVVVAEPEDAGV